MPKLTSIKNLNLSILFLIYLHKRKNIYILVCMCNFFLHTFFYFFLYIYIYIFISISHLSVICHNIKIHFLYVSKYVSSFIFMAILSFLKLKRLIIQNIFCVPWNSIIYTIISIY